MNGEYWFQDGKLYETMPNSIAGASLQLPTDKQVMLIAVLSLIALFVFAILTKNGELGATAFGIMAGMLLLEVLTNGT